MSNLARNWQLVRHTEGALRAGNENLGSVPGLLLALLREEAWREFTLPAGETVTYRRFSEFVAAKPPRGLGATLDLVRDVAGDDDALHDLIDRAEGSHQGHRSDLVNNINEVGRPEGTSRAQALRKLRRDAPGLHAEVLADRLSAHAAMVQAGFRRRTVSVPVDAPESIAKSLRKHLTADHIAQLIALLLPARLDAAPHLKADREETP